MPAGNLVFDPPLVRAIALLPCRVKPCDAERFALRAKVEFVIVVADGSALREETRRDDAEDVVDESHDGWRRAARVRPAVNSAAEGWMNWLTARRVWRDIEAKDAAARADRAPSRATAVHILVAR